MLGKKQTNAGCSRKGQNYISTRMGDPCKYFYRIYFILLGNAVAYYI